MFVIPRLAVRFDVLRHLLRQGRLQHASPALLGQRIQRCDVGLRRLQLVARAIPHVPIRSNDTRFVIIGKASTATAPMFGPVRHGPREEAAGDAPSSAAGYLAYLERVANLGLDVTPMSHIFWHSPAMCTEGDWLGYGGALSLPGGEARVRVLVEAADVNEPAEVEDE